jgi:hypothetical protein
VKVEGGENKGKGAKREREENGDDSVIEIFSDDEDLETLEVKRATRHDLQIFDVTPNPG